MIRFVLPVIFCALPAWAETVTLPPIGAPDAAPALPACEEDRFSQNNCVRVLACIGDEGLWFDGQVRGWGEGTMIGALSNGVPCAGTWTSQGPLGLGLAEMACEDGLTAQAFYSAQDPETGTAIGSGKDSLGRAIRAWSGLHVLDFLAGSDGTPELPCTEAGIPIS